MMAHLDNITKKKRLISELKVAKSFKSRALGLIGTKNLGAEEGLHIADCNWIHMFFMSIPIDVIYLSRDMKVTKLQKNVRPWTLPAPVFSAQSVIELPAGKISQMDIEEGDELYVGD